MRHNARREQIARLRRRQDDDNNWFLGHFDGGENMNGFDSNFDKAFDRMERNAGRIFKFAGVAGVIFVVAELALIVAIIWALVALVLHFT